MANNRSIRINGTTTSIALEPVFWEEVDRRAKQKGISWQVYIRGLLEEYGNVPNRAASVKEDLFNQVRAEKQRLVEGASQTWEVITPTQHMLVTTESFRLLVGREVGCDLTLNDSEVSRNHLLLVFDNKNWWAVDLKSKNGTTLNNKPLLAEQLHQSDVICLGACTLRLA